MTPAQSTEPADAFRLRLDLAAPVAQPKWPAGFNCRTFRDGDAPEIHNLLRLVYAADRSVPDYGSWWSNLSADPEFDPSLCFLVFNREQELVAVAQCWTSAFLKDLAVRGDARRLGLGENLLRQVFNAFGERGAKWVDLKVEVRNATAMRLYKRMGMEKVPFAG